MVGLDRKDFLLYAVAMVYNEPLTPVQLQKAMFLVGQQKGGISELPDDFYQFEPYHYGPHCGQVYEDIRELNDEKLVLHFPSDSGQWKNTYPTRSGLARQMRLMNSLTLMCVGTFKRSCSGYRPNRSGNWFTRYARHIQRTA